MPKSENDTLYSPSLSSFAIGALAGLLFYLVVGLGLWALWGPKGILNSASVTAAGGYWHGRVMSSPINLFSFMAFGMAVVLLFSRWRQIRREETARGDAQAAGNALADARAENARLRGTVRGVLGLRGTMNNTVFLFDTSQSLGTAVRGEERFGEYKQLLKAWITTLQFDRFNLVRFCTKVETLRGWEDVLMEASTENREKLCRYIDTFQPGGNTNTMGALNYALDELDGVDTIILFSDGQPNAQDGSPNGGEAAIQWILGYLKESNRDASGKPKVTINTVAMGDYLNATYGEFLRDLAEQNGGIFIGR